jgi:hypothetical protein
VAALAVAPAASAAAPPDLSTAAVTIGNDQPTGDGRAVLPVSGDGPGIVSVARLQRVQAGTDGTTVTITPPAGQDLHVGHYQSSRSGTGAPAEVVITRGSGSWTTEGVFDVLDIAANADGTLTRVDIVFQTDFPDAGRAYFGQVRLGQPGTALTPSATHLTFPQVPVRSARVWAQESFHNTSGAPMTLGAVGLSGWSPTDWATAGDTCSGTTLAPDASCTVRVGFSPLGAGPRTAVLSVPAGGATVTTSLAGTAPIGTTRITSTGTDSVHRGATFTDDEADHRTRIEQQYSAEGRWWFGADQVESGVSGAHLLGLSVPGNTLALGKHVLTDFGDFQRNGLSLGANGLSCGSVSGTENVLDVARRPDGTLLRAHIRFTTVCGDGSGGATAELQWRDRADVTAPARPAALTVSGAPRTVRWTRSASSDARTTVVRLVAGDGAGATVTSGLPVAMAATGTAAMPTVVTGEQYTLMAWPVDRTGNVGTPRTLAVRG